MAHPKTLLLAITKEGTIKIGLPPKHHQDNYSARAAVLGRLGKFKHVICSPEGELFCVQGKDLYRGPLPSKKEVNWFSKAQRVGKSEWGRFKSLVFHPNGELYGTTKDGEFYKGPQPNNEYLSWMHEQATKIGAKGWEQCEALFFDPSGILYAVSKQDQLVRANPPTTQDYEEWMKLSTVVGEEGWLKINHFMSFFPDGKLWCIDKDKGNIYRGYIPDTGTYIDNAENLGCNYHTFRFLSFTKDKTIRDVISFEFLPERGQRVSESPEVIEERIYNNWRSSSILKHTFTYDKTVKNSSSFSHEHGFTFEVGAETSFKAGIPFVAENETAVKMNVNTSHKWSLTETNETEVKFSSSSEVEIRGGSAIRVTASVVKAELIVPYRARVRTLFGFETEIEGTWNGVAPYNLMVTQEDYGKRLK